MDETEQELVDQIEFLKKQLEEKKKKQEEGSFGSYMKLGAMYANIPHDPYSHQFQLIHKPGRPVTKLEDMLDPVILLSNIEDSRTMFLYQRDYQLLSRFLDMGTRSSGLLSVFNALFYPWVGQMRMTSTMHGRERDLQSFLDVPAMTSAGFGLGWWEKRKRKKQQRRGWQDYMTPQEGSGGGIYD